MFIKGIFHIHSEFSYDSEFSLSRIKEVLIARDCQFGVICDHTRGFDPQKYGRLVDECRSQSGIDFIFIPGLEFEFDSIHILGVGLKEYFKPENIEECLDKIRAQSGSSVWAHPSLHDFDLMKEHRGSLNGMEVWSARYGTKYAPSVKLCDYLLSIQRGGAKIFGYAGQDAHQEDQLKDLYIEMEGDELADETILHNLSTGNFWMRFHHFTIPASGHCRWWQRMIFPIIYNGYQFTEKIIDGMKMRGKA